MPEPSGFAPSQSKKPALHAAVTRLGEIEGLDVPARRVGKVVRGILKPGKVKDVLSGTVLGHPLHPLLTDVPIGTWTSASLLDLFGGSDSETASRRLVAAGLLAALPTIASGYSDWADSEVGSDEARRVGIVHAASNATAVMLYAASYNARRKGNHASGVALALAGAGALGVGGHLGGHLSYVTGVGVDQTTFDEGPADWTATIPAVELPEGMSACAEAGGVAIMLARHEDTIYAMADRCAHRGGPLHEGTLSDGCVTCPWHDSVFALADGSVQRGPATVPQPTYETRVTDGRIEVRKTAG